MKPLMKMTLRLDTHRVLTLEEAELDLSVLPAFVQILTSLVMCVYGAVYVR